MKLLTGKCKEDFKKWAQPIFNIMIFEADYEGGLHHVDVECAWFKIPFSMQYGLLIDFFESVGVYVDITPHLNVNEKLICYYIVINDCVLSDEKANDIEFQERDYAREVCVKKANELYNKK